MKNADTSYITVGKIGSTFGIKGWLKIHSYTEFGASILDYQPWYLSTSHDPNQDQWEAVTIEEGKEHGNVIIAKISGIETPEDARLFTGKLIAIPRSMLPTLKPGEYYWSDLIGLTVINANGETLGKISYLMETGSNDVLVVKGEKEHAIPYLQGSVIKSIDLDKQEMHVDWELL